MNLYKYIKTITEGGTRVLPIKHKEKKPMINGWPASASNESNQIDDWFKDKDMNAGIPTGKINGFWVIDIDKKNNGYESLENLEKLIGPITDNCSYIVETGGGGLHLYFRLREDEAIPSKTNILPGIDIRGEGGQVVSAYSTHITGNIYLPRIKNEN